MADDHNAKLGAAFVAVLGALWLTLTGLCTWSLGHGSELNGMWPIGLFCMAPGLVPLTLGLRSLVPSRVLAAVLIVPGAAWLLIGVSLFIPSLLRPESFRNTGELGLGLAFWLVFQVPGALMVWLGVRRLKSKAGSTDGQGRS